jgi:hypothetical protein
MTNKLTAPPSRVLSGHRHCPHHKLIPRCEHTVCLQTCMHVCILPLGQLLLARSVCWCLAGYLMLETSFTFMLIVTRGKRRARSWRRAGDSFLTVGDRRRGSRRATRPFSFLTSSIHTRFPNGILYAHIILIPIQKGSRFQRNLLKIEGISYWLRWIVADFVFGRWRQVGKVGRSPHRSNRPPEESHCFLAIN